MVEEAKESEKDEKDEDWMVVDEEEEVKSLATKEGEEESGGDGHQAGTSSQGHGCCHLERY